MIPVKTEMIICRINIVQKPDDVQGTKKKAMLNTTRAAFTMMKVVFLPNFWAMGTQRATPAILATSPIPRNKPE